MAATITVFNGPAKIVMDLNGLAEPTIASILDRVLADGGNVPEGATPLVNGEAVDAGATVEEGDEVSFGKATGEKGITILLVRR